jgi:hypothetical protein
MRMCQLTRKDGRTRHRTSTPIHRLLSVQMQRATDDKSEPPRHYTPDAAFTRARGETSSEATAHVHVQAEKLMASDGAAWLGGSAAAHLQIVHGTCLAPSCHSNARLNGGRPQESSAGCHEKQKPTTYGNCDARVLVQVLPAAEYIYKGAVQLK